MYYNKFLFSCINLIYRRIMLLLISTTNLYHLTYIQLLMKDDISFYSFIILSLLFIVLFYLTKFNEFRFLIFIHDENIIFHV
jgi:hypothetical protein